MKKQLIEKYAKLIIEVGINPNKGQKLVISCPVECAEFGRLCLSAAYNAGCGEVIMSWSDDYCTRETYLKADGQVFESYPTWKKLFADDLATKDAARLSIYATDPENLKDVDPKRINDFQRASGKALENFRMLQTKNAFPWCIASVPIDSWAEKVFPGLTGQDAIDRLWDAILSASRADGDPIANWNAHNEAIHRRCEQLNRYRFAKLEYKAANGTDLTVGLMPEGIFAGAAEKDLSGRLFNPNIPSEEIFTTPRKGAAEGIVFSTKPLSWQGSLIEDFSIRFENGKAVEVRAAKGQDALEKMIAMDEGAPCLGECALIPCDSPINNTGILFYNTLFDENASCHLALGRGFENCVEGFENMTQEQLRAMGVNDSMIHVDFMIGAPDLDITGILPDGTRVPVFRNGEWCF